MTAHRRMLIAAAGALAATQADSLRAAPPARVPAGRSFDSAGVPIHYVEAGRGEPVVLVHGYASAAEAQFVEPGLFGALAASHRVVGMDARGHGRSGKPHDPAAYGPEMGLDVVRLLDHLGLPRAHVVGYSMGAHIAAQLLTRHPERFATATLGGASGRRDWTAEDQRRVDAEAAEMDRGLLSSLVARLWPRDRPPPTEAQLRERSAELLAGQDPRALAAVRRSNPAQVVTEAEMAAVAVPTLGVVGSADPYLGDFRRLKAAMPRLRLVVVEGASHGDLPARPEFREALVEFLRSHPARG